MSEPNRKEDYHVKASLIGKGEKVCDVPCKIFLPERIYEKPAFFFKPENSADAVRLAHFDGEFRAEIVGFDQKLRTTVYAKAVYCSQGGTHYWGTNLAEPYAHGEPQHLMIVDHYDSHELHDKTEIDFWITPNELLTPSIFFATSYLGEIKCERHSSVEFLIKGGIKLVFDLHFKTKHIDTGDMVQWSYLVACAELATQATDLETLRTTVLPNIDDFLLIASLAAGKRTACLGWEATDQHSHATYYRGNYAFPNRDADRTIRDGLPDHQSAKEFIETCYANFLAHENQLALRYAICAAVPLDQHSVEATFLSRFAGLETLLLSFRKQEELEHILSPVNWRKLRKSLEKCIKESTEPQLEHEQRASIYNKLEELNRVSVREAFDIFRQYYGIYLSDLWPVFGDKEAIGLIDIRNKLIHGDPFPNELIDALSMANVHLQFALERSLARVLGWDIARSKISPASIGYYFKNSVTNFSAERKRLTDYIRGE